MAARDRFTGDRDVASLRKQERDQNHDLDCTSLHRRPCRQQHTPERAGKRNQTGGAGMVKVWEQSIRESRSERPRLSAASTSPERWLNASRARRAATAAAVIVPPSTIPNTGTSATPVNGTTWVTSKSGMTEAIPAARDNASHRAPWSA